jgi:hypothetical protein
VWAGWDGSGWKTGQLHEHGAEEGLDPSRGLKKRKELGRVRGGFREGSGPGRSGSGSRPCK